MGETLRIIIATTLPVVFVDEKTHWTGFRVDALDAAA